MVYKPVSEIKQKAVPEIKIILDHLEGGYSLTSEEANERFKIRNLNQIIARLRKRGHAIEDVKTVVDGKMCKKYYLPFEL
jgi:type III secretory pathway component EscV